MFQAKLKLEMAQEQMRQKHAKELDEKEEEMEEMRSSTQKKVQSLSYDQSGDSQLYCIVHRLNECRCCAHVK